MIKKFLFLFICVALVATIVGCSLHSGHGHGSANADLSTTLSGTVRDDGTLAEITFASGAKVSAPTAGTMQPNVVVTVTESKTSEIGANAIGTPSYIYLYTITAILTSDNNLTEDVLVSSLEQPLSISLPTNYLGTSGVCYVGIRFSPDDPWQYRVVSENGTIALNLRGKASSIPSECNIDLYRPNIQLALFVYDETSETASSTANIAVSEMTATSTPVINIVDGAYQEDLTVKLSLEGANLNGLNASDLTAYVTFRSSNATAMTIKSNGTNVNTTSASDKAVTGANYTHTFKVPSLTFENQLGTTAELSFVINTKDMATSAFPNELLIELVGESDEVIGQTFVCTDYFTFAVNGGNTEPTPEPEPGIEYYTLNLIKGTGIDSVSGAGSYQAGTSVTASCTMLAGYEFANWSGDFTTGTFNMPANNATMTANATPISYSITYDLASGTLEGTNPASYDVTSATITLINPTRSGYAFLGWTGTGIATGTASETVIIPAGSTGDRSYVASWTESSLTITLAEGVTMELKPCGDTGMFMGTYEVTQEQYSAIMGTNPSMNSGNASCPVECVSWDAIMANDGFIAKLNASDTIQAYLTAKGLSGYQFALPTQSQWKTACDAGTTTEDSDDNVNDRAWYYGNWGAANMKTHDVGYKSPNAWGLYDMRGNVTEWTSTQSGSSRVVCGGSWCDDADSCRSSSFITCDPDYDNDYVGFRVALFAPFE